MARHHTAFWLSVFTVTYNVAEGAISLVFSRLDGSTALFGFGADSFVESLSGTIMIWRFAGAKDIDERERRAAQLVGLSFLVLAAYVVYESLTMLALGEGPDRSVAGLIIAIVSLVVMPPLFLLKRRTALALKSGSLLADAKQTLACVLLSVVLLFGTGLNDWLGFWQADPIAGIVIALFLIREGYEAITKCEVCAR